ncbi:MAG: antitoxin [Leptospira sp.]|nr:antitoxin [Leptospira sp.]
MKNVTFRVEDDKLIEKARLKARSLNRSLNDLFLDWLKTLSNDNSKNLNYEEYISKFKHIKIDRTFSRNEMNER